MEILDGFTWYMVLGTHGHYEITCSTLPRSTVEKNFRGVLYESEQLAHRHFSTHRVNPWYGEYLDT